MLNLDSNITRTASEGFFSEWYADLPEITEADKAALNLIRRRYLYHLNELYTVLPVLRKIGQLISIPVAPE